MCAFPSVYNYSTCISLHDLPAGLTSSRQWLVVSLRWGESSNKDSSTKVRICSGCRDYWISISLLIVVFVDFWVWICLYNYLLKEGASSNWLNWYYTLPSHHPLGSTRDWSFIHTQIGMFCYSGMNLEQVKRLQDEYGIYMTKDGRISMVSLSSNNIGYVAKSMHEVTK